MYLVKYNDCDARGKQNWKGGGTSNGRPIPHTQMFITGLPKNILHAFKPFN